MWLWLLSTVAGAREYRLDPAVTSITLDGLLTVAASEIDLTPKDYVITMELHNAGPSRLELLNLQCTRGRFVTPVAGERGRRIELEPGESRSLQLLCDHGREAMGDPTLRIHAVHSEPEGGASSAVFKNVVWRMKEADITSDRSRAGVQLATGAFDRPVATRAVAPVVLPPDAPLAVPAGRRADPIPEPRAAAAPAATTAPAAVAPATPAAKGAPAPAAAPKPKPPAPPPPAATLKPSPG